MPTMHHAGLTFDIIENGPADGEPVVLLHGFPQHADSWDALSALLTANGYRTLAMNQRGYSRDARPRGRRAYRITELVADVVALIDTEAAGGPVHVVGHDWGAAVAWALTATHPERVASLTALSVPHPFAFLTAMLTSAQALKSWYMYVFQLPWLPERLLLNNPVRTLIRLGLSPEQAHRDAAGFPDAEALRPAINWYRAMPLVDPRVARAPIHRPTLYVWSDGDVAISRQAAQRCARYVHGPYEFVTLAGVNHWIPDQSPDELADLLLPHLRSWPATT